MTEQIINKKNPFKYLNNLTFTKKSINQIIKYINTGILPKFDDERQKKKFIKRFSKDWSYWEEKKFLHFDPLEIVAVPIERIEKSLQFIYDQPTLSLGKGVQSFYDTVKTYFVGISIFFLTNKLKDYVTRR